MEQTAGVFEVADGDGPDHCVHRQPPCVVAALATTAGQRRRRQWRSSIGRVVPGVGFEPTCPEGRPVLSRLRQPVAPSGRDGDDVTFARERFGRFSLHRREQGRERVDGQVLARLAGVDLEVQMRPGRVAGHADVADDVARDDDAVLALVLGEVRVVVGDVVETGEPCAVAARAADVVAQNPVGHRDDRRAGERAHVDPRMRTAGPELGEVVGEHDDALHRALGRAGGDVGAVLRAVALDHERVHLVVGSVLATSSFCWSRSLSGRQVGERLLEVGALGLQLRLPGRELRGGVLELRARRRGRASPMVSVRWAARSAVLGVLGVHGGLERRGARRGARRSARRVPSPAPAASAAWARSSGICASASAISASSLACWVWAAEICAGDVGRLRRAPRRGAAARGRAGRAGGLVGRVGSSRCEREHAEQGEEGDGPANHGVVGVGRTGVSLEDAPRSTLDAAPSSPTSRHGGSAL